MENERPCLLLADNSIEYRRSLLSILQLENFEVVEASSAEEARDKLVAGDFALALVDLRLEDDSDAADISGLELAKFAGEQDTPCIIITAFATVQATRMALRARGLEPPLATDLIPKADGPQAILDAIRRVLSVKVASAQDLVIELKRGQAWHAGAPLDLSRQQYELLSYMYKKRGAVCTPEELLKTVYGADVPPNEATADKRLERLISRVRGKLEADPSKPKHLVKVQGRGYRLEIEG